MAKLNKAYEERETARLRELMKDPRYWKKKDPAYVDMIRQGFQNLYDNPPPEALAAEGKAANQIGINGQNHGQDTIVAHVTPGEIVIPLSAQTPQLMEYLSQTLGDDILKYTVGSGHEQENPVSGLPAFADGYKDRFADNSSYYFGGERKPFQWHYEDRDAKNVYLPENVNDARKFGSRWEEMPENQNIFHDNGKGKMERKFINPDGREAIYDGDTGNLLTDLKLRGTYNYANAWNENKPLKKPGDYLEYGARWAGHAVSDVIPWMIGGNDR
ncbi:hypothetical protein [Terasakiella sp.]|uniref:hypothetical protein n=1 Tax=Terasakiella sp. TaxID=2034861 RepID=UPI003AA83C9A